MLKLKELDPYKSMHLDGISPRVLGELADIIAGPLSIIFLWSWQSGEAPVEWQLAKVVPIFKKGKKKTPVITALSVSGQCLLKLGRRLSLKLLKSAWGTVQSFLPANMGSRGLGPV